MVLGGTDGGMAEWWTGRTKTLADNSFFLSFLQREGCPGAWLFLPLGLSGLFLALSGSGWGGMSTLDGVCDKARARDWTGRHELAQTAMLVRQSGRLAGVIVERERKGASVRHSVRNWAPGLA